MKMMQDGKDAEKGEQIDAEEGEARAWFKENRESSSLTADDGPSLPPGILLRRRARTTSRRLPAWIYNEPIGMARYVKRFHDRGMNVLAPAARAQRARSGGGYIGMGWPERLDVVALIGGSLRPSPKRILVFGESMGAATAMNERGNLCPQM